MMTTSVCILYRFWGMCTTELDRFTMALSVRLSALIAVPENPETNTIPSYAKPAKKAFVERNGHSHDLE